MPFTASDLTAIKDELTNNPLSLSGYLPHTAPNDVANADALNLVRVELQIDREAIPMSEIGTLVDGDEWDAIGESRQRLLIFYAFAGSINPQTGSEVRETFLQSFGAVTETRAKLQAILTEDANRVEHMFKNGLLSQGGSVTPSDVANARSA